MPHGRGRLVDDLLQDRVDLLALGEQLVEQVLAEHGAQRRLRDLRRRDHEVLDLHDRVLRLDDPEVGDRVHAHRDVVLGDDLLRRDVQRDRPQVDLDHPVDDRDQEEEARALRLAEQPAEPEDDPALVLAGDLDRRDQEQDDQEEDDCEDDDGAAVTDVDPTPAHVHDRRARARRSTPTTRTLLARPSGSPSAVRALPELAVDEHEAVAPGLADLADHRLRRRRGPAGGAPATRLRDRERPEAAEADRERDDERRVDVVVRRRRVVEEQQRSRRRGDQPRRR